jgi:uncharacterized protein
MRLEPRPRCTGLALLALGTLNMGCSRDLTDVVEDGAEAVRASLERSADPNRLDSRGDAPIHVATLRHQPETVRVLLAHGAKVDIVTRGGATALVLAVNAGCIPCAFELLSAHANPNAVVDTADLDRVLHRAARAGSPELVSMLLAAGADPNARASSGATPLHFAAAADEYRAPVVAKLLVERGANIRATDVMGETPVHSAAVYNSTELLAYYASIGADLNSTNSLGDTPLDRAAERHQDHATDVLYELGARATRPDFEPPLIAAARVDDVERVRWLLVFGADPNRPFNGKSAMDVARESGFADVTTLLAGAFAGR